MTKKIFLFLLPVLILTSPCFGKTGQSRNDKNTIQEYKVIFIFRKICGVMVIATGVYLFISNLNHY